MKKQFRLLILLATICFVSILGLTQVRAKEHTGRYFQQTNSFDAAEARQGVAVDRNYFYAINNREIGKYDKKTGELVDRWQGPKNGPIIHLDSGMVGNGKLYAAHSN